MLRIEGNNIYLTRGDTAYITVPITKVDSQGNEEEYTVKPDDRMLFTAKGDVRSDQSDISIEVIGSNVFHIKPQDTSGLEFGNYRYDIELKTSVGDVFTVVADSVFSVTTEVG